MLSHFHFPARRKKYVRKDVSFSFFSCFLGRIAINLPFTFILKEMLINVNIPEYSQRQDSPKLHGDPFNFLPASCSLATFIDPLSENGTNEPNESTPNGRKKTKIKSCDCV